MRVTSRGRSREHRVLPVTCPVTRSFLPSPRRLPSLLSTNHCTPSTAKAIDRLSLSSSPFYICHSPVVLLRSCAPSIRSFFLPPSSKRSTRDRQTRDRLFRLCTVTRRNGNELVMIALVLARFDDMFIPAPPLAFACFVDRSRTHVTVSSRTVSCVRCSQRIKF